MLNEVKRLTENGYQEFVLTGIHLSSYGVDCEDTLLSLVQAVHEVPGVGKRIRLGSLEPKSSQKNLPGHWAICLKSVPIFICPYKVGAMKP